MRSLDNFLGWLKDGMSFLGNDEREYSEPDFKDFLDVDKIFSGKKKKKRFRK